MSTLAPPRSPVAATAVTPGVRHVVRRTRLVLVAAAILAVLTIASLLLAAPFASTADFAADNAGPRGGRALAEVLRQQGVRVTLTDSLATARRTARGALLVVDDSDHRLEARQWRGLLGSTDRLVVVAPGYAALDGVLPAARLAGSPGTSSASAGCTDPLARRAGTMSLAGAASSLRLVGAAAGTAVCFGRDGTGQLVTGRNGGVAVTLLASIEPFENRSIDRAGNAAVALGAFGPRRRMVWLRPGLLESAAGATPTLATLTPQWVTPFMLLMLAAAVAAAFWRGRRFGPLVVERLPVVVRSRETVEGRARLYARAGARLRAADALRIGAISRLAPLLGLSRLATVDEVAIAAAARTGRRASAVHAILVGAEPRSDRALVALSDDLALLEAAVRRAAGPAPAVVGGAARHDADRPHPPRTTGAP